MSGYHLLETCFQNGTKVSSDITNFLLESWQRYLSQYNYLNQYCTNVIKIPRILDKFWKLFLKFQKHKETLLV